MKTFTLLLLSSACVLVSSRPQSIMATSSTTLPSTTTTIVAADSYEDLYGKSTEKPLEDDNLTPIISKFHVRSDIQFRYSRTVVESYVKNPSRLAKEISFHMIMPKKAFVSNFSMLIGEDEFVAKVQEKEEAQETFNQAVSAGQSAGIVNQDAREANKIVIKTNVEAQGKVKFTLTYEELLQRKLGRYEQIVHVNPGQIVDDFSISVYINESLPVQNVRVPELKTDPNAITSSNENKFAKVEKDPEDPSKVMIQYKPSSELQKQESKSGLAGQFIVQYDVDRKDESSDIQVIDGYFVHFFTPDKLETLPKHVIFVLDLSGSMSGRKLDQTKDAMVTILDDMSDKDSFNILTFSDNVYHWKSENEKLKEGPHSLTYPGTEEMRNEALAYVLELNTIGGTNINDGLLEGIKLAKEVRAAEVLKENVKPMIIFLTDGEATSGVTNSDDILKNVQDANELDVPIYGLAFGRGADFGLIKKVSEKTNGLARKIYEGSDAAIQLEDFYLEIANPLLSDVEFDYVGEAIQNGSVTKTAMGTFNRGGEFVIAGKIDEPKEDEPISVQVEGKSANGVFSRRVEICFRKPLPVPVPLPAQLEDSEDTTTSDVGRVIDPVPGIWPWPCFPIPAPEPEEPKSNAQNFIERLWAFTTINNLLEEDAKEKDDENEVENDILEEKEISQDNDTDVSENFEEDENAPRALPSVDETTSKPKETSRQKALKLALKYNFVTPITSLVVTRPSNKAEDSDEETLKPVPIDLVPTESASRGNIGFGGFGVRTVALSASGLSLNRIASKRRGPTATRFSSSSMHLAGPAGFPGPLLAARPVPSPPQNFYQPTAMMDDLDSDYDSNYMPTTSTTTTTPKTSCSGFVRMFNETYRRGESVTITDDIQDINDIDFAKKLTSLEVEGDCCWEVFKEPNFQGKSLQFNLGKYDGYSKLKFLLRNAGSVKRLFQCN